MSRSHESAAPLRVVVEGGCHCGYVTFAVQGPPRSILVCNCSICTMKGYLHWIVPRDDFKLVTPSAEAHLPIYRFGTRVAAHYFCPTCGVPAFYIPRSDPDRVDVNLRCVRNIDLDKLPLQTFDGQNWEASYELYRRG